MMDVRDMAIERNPRLFTVEEYHRMGEAGVFAPDERVELLDGEILIVPPMGPLHASSVERVNRAFVLRLAEHASVRPGLPVELSNFSEPEPDFTLARRRLDAYESAAVRPRTSSRWSRSPTRRWASTAAASCKRTRAPACRSTGSSTCANGPSSGTASRTTSAMRRSASRSAARASRSPPSPASNSQSMN